MNAGFNEILQARYDIRENGISDRIHYRLVHGVISTRFHGQCFEDL